MAGNTSNPTETVSTRVRVCSDCGKTETVNRINKASRCRGCGNKIAHANALVTFRARKLYAKCEHCGSSIPTCKSKLANGNNRFCSVACKSAYARMDRTCKQCGNVFSAYKSILSGKTNSSGNFCCRPCYEKWLCRTDRTTGRGSRWLAARTESVRRNPFCALCGTTRKLDVHHIVPFRLTHDNSQDNLIPLCKRHHKVVEVLFCEIQDQIGDEWDTIKFILGTQLRERQDIARMILLKLIRQDKAA